MSKRVNAVLDSGPFIHLKEVNALKALELFELHIPAQVLDEIENPKEIKYSAETVKNKTLIELLSARFGLGLGEAAAIALGKQLKIKLLLTDDLDARTTAKKFGLEPHGSIGILLKAFKKKIFTKKQTMKTVKKLKTDSSLYITNQLVNYVLQEIKKSK